MMLDILALAPDSLKQRLFERELISKQEYFNEILSRLKERNMMNDILIKKYIRRGRRKHFRDQFTLTLREQGQRKKGNEAAQEKINYEEKDGCLSHRTEKRSQREVDHASPEELLKENDLKETNHTLNDLLNDNEEKVCSIPTLDLREATQRQKSKLKTDLPASGLVPAKCDRQFTKYLRNFLLNKIAQNSRLKSKEMEVKSMARRSYQGRVHTEIETHLKYKIKVHSLVFGSSEVVCPQGSYYKKQSNFRVKTESKEHSRYEYSKPNENKSNGILPNIQKSFATKNRHCLENYIRLHQEKLGKERRLQDFRTIKLPTEVDLISQSEDIPRKGNLHRLNSIHLGK